MNHHPLLSKGLEEFNRRQFFESHETLEDYWRTLAGDEKELVQSIIQAAVAYYHFQNGNRIGARKLLVRAIARAQSVPEGTCGIETLSYLKTIEQSLTIVDAQEPLAEMPMPQIRFKQN